MNNTIFFFFYNLAHRSEFFDKFVVFIAHTFPYIVIFLAGIFLLFHHDVLLSKNPFKVFAKRWKEIVLVFFSGIFAWCISQVLKLLIHTPRPFVEFQNVSSLIPETGFAFPSGHATFYMALAFAIFFSHKKIGYLFIFFALLIGVARIVAGVHFPIDILGGFILGILTAYLVRFLYKKLNKQKTQQ
ncbi:MAG: phosphatase PAP2 family protein [Candidatus Paceibacterota bacterium]|jgi:undecaprenyl-diphosphatase